MKLLDRIKGWFGIQPQVTNSAITIRENTPHLANTLRNKLWYRGDSAELQQFYESFDDGVGQTSFWSSKSVTGINFRKIHTGLPQMIIDKLVDIVVDDLNGINITTQDGKSDISSNKFWEDMTSEFDFKDTLKDALRKTSIVGDSVFKLAFDSSISDYPIIEVVSGEDVEFEYKRGRLVEIKFYSKHAINKKEYLLEELYGRGYIKQNLYDENEKTQDETFIKEVLGLETITWEGLEIMAVPLMLSPSAKYKGRGKALLDSKSDAFDSYDEAYSQWIDALRAGRTQTYIPEDLIPRYPGNGQLVKMAPNMIDNRYIAKGNAIMEGAENKIETVTPEIQHESYMSTYSSALDLCLQGLISPSTLGIDVKKLDNAEAQREKEKATLYTRNKMVGTLEKVIPQLIITVFKLQSKIKSESIHEDGIQVSVDFGEYANPSFEATVETVGKAKTDGIMSTEMCVEQLYGDSLTKEEKKEEVERLKNENGIGISEPSINDIDPYFVDPTQTGELTDEV